MPKNQQYRDRSGPPLWASRRGAVAVLFALTAIPMILAVGAATDYMRMQVLRTSLQSIVDDSALAGASVLNQPNGQTTSVSIAQAYFNKGAATLTDDATVSAPTVTVPDSITVHVSAQATLKTTFMGLVMSNMPVSVSATAKGPGYELQFNKTGGFTSQAADSDSIYFYVVPANGAVPTSISQMTLLFTNDPKVDPNYQTDDANPKYIAVGANDKVGFALVNITGGISSYSSNQYGGTTGSTHIFYSSLAAPSMDAYSNQQYYQGEEQQVQSGWWYSGNQCKKTAITATNSNWIPTSQVNTHQCSTTYAYPCVTATGGSTYQNNLLVGANQNSLTCSTPSTAVQTCLQLYENPLTFAWNDMGGGTDDYDYNDAVYSVTCLPNTSGTGNSEEPAAVILTQ